MKRSPMNQRQKAHRGRVIPPSSGGGSLITPSEWNPPSQSSRSGRTENVAVVNEEVRVLSLEEQINGRQQRQPNRQGVMGKGIRKPSQQEVLTKENKTLKEENKFLTDENKILREQLAKMSKTNKDLENQNKTLTLISNQQEKQLEKLARLNQQKEKDAAKPAVQKNEKHVASDVSRKQVPRQQQPKPSSAEPMDARNMRPEPYKKNEKFVAVPVVEHREDPNQNPVRPSLGYYEQHRREQPRGWYPTGYRYPSAHGAYAQRDWWDRYYAEREYRPRFSTRRMQESRYPDHRDQVYHQDFRTDDTPPNPNLRNSSAPSVNGATRIEDIPEVREYHRLRDYHGRDAQLTKEWRHPPRHATDPRWEELGRRVDRPYPRSQSDGPWSERGQATSVPMNQRRRSAEDPQDLGTVVIKHVQDKRCWDWLRELILSNFCDCQFDRVPVNGKGYIYLESRSAALYVARMINELKYTGEQKSYQRLIPILLVPMSESEQKRLARADPGDVRTPEIDDVCQPRQRAAPRDERRPPFKEERSRQSNKSWEEHPKDERGQALHPEQKRPGEGRRPGQKAEPRMKQGSDQPSAQAPTQKRQNQHAPAANQAKKHPQPEKNPYEGIGFSKSDRSGGLRSRGSWSGVPGTGPVSRPGSSDGKPGSRQRPQNPKVAPLRTEQRFRKGPPGSSVGESNKGVQQHVKSNVKSAVMNPGRPGGKRSVPAGKTELKFKLGKPSSESNSASFGKTGPQRSAPAQKSPEEQKTGEKGAAGKRMKGLVMGPHDPTEDVVREPVNFSKKKKRKSSSRKSKKR